MATINQHALSDVSMIEIVTKAGETYTFDTADEVTIEEVLDEGEEQTLKIKGRLYANRAAEDTVLGSDITCKDNLMSPELLLVLQGGTIKKDTDGSFKSYSAPATGAADNRTKFDCNIYTAEVSTDGDTGRYLKVTYPDCYGSSVPLTFQDGVYFTNSYTIKSRPAKGSSPYTVTFVDELPTVTEES